jgi:hypothetical protein
MKFIIFIDKKNISKRNWRRSQMANKRNPHNVLINFEIRTELMAKYEDLATTLGKSRSEFIRDAMADYYHRYYQTHPRPEASPMVTALTEKLQTIETQITTKLNEYFTKIDKLPELPAAAKAPAKDRILELLQLGGAMRGQKVVKVLGLPETEALVVLEELRKLGLVKFNRGVWSLSA